MSALVNDTFVKLIAAYPTFDLLKAYLGSIGVKMNAKEGERLVIFRYQRESCQMADPVVRVFRSVIWDSETHKPVFVAPQKSQLMETLPSMDFSKMIVEDFVDGVMVNVFMDPLRQSWRIATRSRLDADNKFFKHTFSDLFLSTWGTCYPGQGFSMLNPAYGYSFVLQHPSNRIVSPVSQPKIVCVEMTLLDPNGYLLIGAVPPATSVTDVQPPRRFAVSTLNDCQLMLSNMEQFEGISSQGIVIRDVTTGNRWKARTNTYTAVRKLRGNHSQLEYVWFDNLKKGTLEQYLAVYPEESVNAQALAANWTQIVSDIYNWYVHVFKVKDVPKETIPAQYKGMLFDLHGQYINRLSKEKKSLDWKEHMAIMATQDLKRMVFLATFKAGDAAPPSVAKRQKFVAAKAAQKAAAATVTPVVVMAE